MHPIQRELEKLVADGLAWKCSDPLCGTITKNFLPACHNCGRPKPEAKKEHQPIDEV